MSSAPSSTHWIARQPRRDGRQLGLHDGRRDPGRELGRGAGAVRRAARRARPGSTASLASLLLHGRFIRSHLEWGEVRGNHYLSDVVGLLPVAALFSGSAEGRAWAAWAAGELEREMAHQVRAGRLRPRGLDPLPPARVRAVRLRHAGRGRAAARDGCPEPYRQRLDLMLEFVARLHAPGRPRAAGRRRRRRPLPPARRLRRRRPPRPPPPVRSRRAAPYEPATRTRRLSRRRLLRHARRATCTRSSRCGDVGLDGVGGARPQRPALVRALRGRDAAGGRPGAYLYTADPAARNLFRSTAYHATLLIGTAPSRTSCARTTSSRSRTGPTRRRSRGSRSPTERSSRAGTTASRCSTRPAVHRAAARASRRRARARDPRRRDRPGPPTTSSGPSRSNPARGSDASGPRARVDRTACAWRSTGRRPRLQRRRRAGIRHATGSG